MSRDIITFGVELEFGIAWLPDCYQNPFPQDDRQVRFTSSEEDHRQADSGVVNYRTVGRHIVETLGKAGFHSTIESNNPQTWDLTTDASVKEPEQWGQQPFCDYVFIPVEIRSPAYQYTEAALKDIRTVCAILANTYLININDSCGLHVHVGYGNKGFNFDHVKRLMAFLWAFEPQISSINPSHRFNNKHTGMLRDFACMARHHQEQTGKRLEPFDGAYYILDCPNMDSMIREINDTEHAPALRLNHLYNFQQGLPKSKPTIEFRHHAGTVDGEAITNWVNSVVGFVDYTRSPAPVDYYSLIKLVQNEHWEKIGDGNDHKREASKGLILAEGTFTIIDLLHRIGQYESAKYYQRRGIYRISKKDSYIKHAVETTDKTPYWLKGTSLDPALEEFKERQERMKREAQAKWEEEKRKHPHLFRPATSKSTNPGAESAARTEERQVKGLLRKVRRRTQTLRRVQSWSPGTEADDEDFPLNPPPNSPRPFSEVRSVWKQAIKQPVAGSRTRSSVH